MTDRAGASRILVGTAADLELQVYVDGVATLPSAATVTVTTEGGDTIVTDGATVTSGTKKKYTLTPAQNDAVEMLTVTWTCTISAVPNQIITTYVQAVGELLFTLGDARTFDEAALASAVTYPTDAILRARDQVTDAFEERLGRALGAHYRREILSGDGYGDLDLPGIDIRTVRSVKSRTSGTQTWTAYTSDELLDVLVNASGLITRESLGVFTSGNRNLAVEYEYGMQPIPIELKMAGLRLLRQVLVKSDINDRAISQTNEFGALQFAVAGKGGSWFGIPEVDAAITTYRRKLPGMA